MVDFSNEIEVIKTSNITLCFIKDFSDNLKSYIKEVLTVVCYGPSINTPEQIKYYSFEDTITRFKENYDSKPIETKKGMIGELLAHILINLYQENLKVFSPYFNKEEASIRKGFDILYIDTNNKCVRYGEVKSGEKLKDKSINQSNNSLLYDAEVDLKNKFTASDRVALWDNAKFDANTYIQSIASTNNINLHELLQNDRHTNLSNDKNVILISVCFNDLNNKINIEEIEKFETRHNQRNSFLTSILFSIQKSTFQKIENFLNEEYEKCK